MSQPAEGPPAATEEILEHIHRLQDEIHEREERIRELVEGAGEAESLDELRRQGEEKRRLRQIERLLSDWDRLIQESREATGDDLDLLAALVRLVGDLMIIQPEGVDEQWIAGLEEYLRQERAKIS